MELKWIAITVALVAALALVVEPARYPRVIVAVLILSGALYYHYSNQRP